MPGPWDSKLKSLITEEPQDFVSWLVEGATYEEEISSHLKSRHIDADVLYRISVNGRPYLLHIEFQVSGKSNMAERLWEYNVLATIRNKLSVYSFVIYLTQKKGSSFAAAPYLREAHNGLCIHQFHFETIKLWEVPTVQLKGLGLKGLLPLLPLTQDGRSTAVVDDVITELTASGGKSRNELLSLTYGLASLIFSSEDEQGWLKRRFGMLDELLKESWAFQEILQQGIEQGREQGIEQGREQGLEQGREQGREQGLEQGREQGLEQGREQERQQELEALRQLLVTLVENRYAALVPSARKKVEAISDTGALQQLILHVSLAPHEDDVRRHLEAD